jgi:hypothetical protein
VYIFPPNDLDYAARRISGICAGPSILRGLRWVDVAIFLISLDLGGLVVERAADGRKGAAAPTAGMTTASAAGRPKTISCNAPKAARPLYTAIVPPDDWFCSLETT